MGTLEQTLSTPLGVVEWFVYLLAAVMFVIGLHLMNSPKTARRGNLISAAGMVMACVMAFIVLFVGEAGNGFQHGIAVALLIAGIAIGAIVGVWSAKKVKMTDMPQLVSVFNTVGGGAAALVALNDILNSEEAAGPGIVVLITAGLGIMIGSVTFTGSLVAAGKLQGVKFLRKLTLPAKGVWNIAFIVLTIAAFVMLCVQPSNAVLWCILTTVFALAYGLVFVIPIGGADMPVVISVLNACTGTAVAMSGLAINNIALIVAGALVGAAGVTLSLAMSKAMNRPLMSVLAGGFGGGSDAAGSAEGPEGTMKETTADDVAVQLVYADKVIFVPGFGLAQAQAQRELADLGELLKGHGVEVEYAIHPVAGRMPGHMNVLLAEANVPYEELVDLDDINPQFPSANVALVVGANDVTNPAARRPGTPVSGMPILDVDKAQNVVVMKRGRGKGYAGIENELYFKDNTQMLFGDAKAGLQAVIAAVKELIN
ncbi:NAD(P) transhydrogenase subunit beta [Bifidobacterium goeldii]|uniref:NAD(P) transhydrogenase subunit beta n=1 Tax=Bifidobacterium goeldii TaxID=2306975 RepID=A0A430FMD5_9BIFI|nr:NAD(P)(+) transhydrogenase (Re/Si-specific) subunit beta [Bifidobacterium goeldii]RSX53908.1 NAD(P) transhydrogenase subunit beta [Bifidobacterium goeldii]